MNIPVTDTTERLIQLLVRKYEEEPKKPDSDTMLKHEMDEAGLIHYGWQREIDSLRLLIGVRLTNEALHYIQPTGT